MLEIYNRKITDDKIDMIIDFVTNKKDLANLDRDFIINHAIKFLEQNTSVLDYIVEHDSKDIEKSSKFKSMIKHIRGKARKVYGIFQTAEVKKREELLEKYLKTKKKEDLIELLNTHRSTKERLGYNEKLYRKIFEITKKPESILDIGAGLNPLTFDFMGLDKSAEYIATELSQKDVDFLNLFFRKEGMKNSTAVKTDLLKDYGKLSDYKTDICFAFKILDSLETVQKNISYKILQSIKSSYIIVSFPLYSIAGKKMRLQRRNWLEKAAKRLNFEATFFEMENELFYVLKKIL